MNDPKTHNTTEPGKLDYFLLNLPDGTCLTFIGKCRGLDARTVELCTPDGRPVLQVPRTYVTRTTRQETEQRILEDLRHRRASFN